MLSPVTTCEELADTLWNPAPVRNDAELSLLDRKLACKRTAVARLLALADLDASCVAMRTDVVKLAVIEDFDHNSAAIPGAITLRFEAIELLLAWALANRIAVVSARVPPLRFS